VLERIPVLIFNVIKTIVVVCVACIFFTSTAFAQSAFEDPGSRSSNGSKGGDLVSASGDVDAGEVALGASSQVVILIRNDGGKPISSGNISLYPSSNVSASIAQNECQGVALPSDAVCAIALSIKGLQPGRFRIEMLMRHNGRAKLITSTISGRVDISADSTRDVINDLETIPSEITFGRLTESRPLTRSVVLRNVTSKPITVNEIEIESNDSSGYSLKSDCEKLDSGGACIATVTWAPQQRGPATGVLVVNHDGPTGVVSILLDGEYEPTQAAQVGVFPEAVPGKGLLTASQTNIAFGSNIETASSITVSLVNVGDAPVKLNDIRLSSDDNGIQIAETGCAVGGVLNPVEACPLTLTWEPVRVGSVLEDVQVIHDGARGILVLPITGTSTMAVNQDSKSIVFDDGAEAILRAIEPVPAKDLSESKSEASAKTQRKASLDGYRITSLAKNRAIVSGPGGSRVVFDGQESVVGGALWKVTVQSSAVQFRNRNQKVLLLFDQSLSPFIGGASSAPSSSATVVTP